EIVMNRRTEMKRSRGFVVPAALLAGALLMPAISSHAATAPAPRALDKATFALGCFWSGETAFEGLPGVKSVVSGYSGGHTTNPTYEEVSTGTTGHLESVQLTYDPKVISYDQLLDLYWHNVDPTTNRGQFCDWGTEYRPAIFVA